MSLVLCTREGGKNQQTSLLAQKMKDGMELKK
jgi:hypothetical protein